MGLVDLFIQEEGREPTGNVQDEVQVWAEQQIKDYVQFQQLAAQCFERNNALIAERDALAAHIDCIKAVERDETCYGQMIMDILDMAPTTSLARRDLIKQAEALEKLSKQV